MAYLGAACLQAICACAVAGCYHDHLHMRARAHYCTATGMQTRALACASPSLPTGPTAGLMYNSTLPRVYLDHGSLHEKPQECV